MAVHRFVVILTLVLAAAVAIGIGAQDRPANAGDPPPCSFDDELEDKGECCQPTAPTIPIAFPGVEQQIRYFTWNNCRLARNKTLCVELSPLEFARDGEGDLIGCGTYVLPVAMRTCGQQAIDLFSGDLRATYSRTWLSAEPGEMPSVQIWRFMINGDLTVAPFVTSRYGTNPHLPQCYDDHGDRIHWFGHVDYRRNCDTFEWEVEWVLEHSCDEYSHGTGSQRPGTFHPGRTFNFAGPSSFVPTIDFPHVEPEYDTYSVGLRRIEYRGNDFARCYRYESPLQVDAFNEETGCLCGSSNEAQYTPTVFGMFGACNSLVLNSTPTTTRKKVGYFEDSRTGIPRYISTWTGMVFATDTCNPESSDEFLEGVGMISNTSLNYRLTEEGTLVLLRVGFVDLASSNDDTGGFLRGVPHFSKLHINLNQ